MAFMARSQRVRCGHVPIAFSDMTQCAIFARMGLLGRAPVVITRTSPLRLSRPTKQRLDADRHPALSYETPKKRAEPYTKIIEELPQMRREAV
jgi:hypothetical protein